MNSTSDIKRQGHGIERRGAVSPLVICLLFCFLVSGLAPAQTRNNPSGEYLVDTWETDRGLPQMSATAAVQTPDGYLWFGTFGGLARFDGVEFTVFTPVNTPQLAGADIINLHLDRTGRLWISTGSGMACVKDGVWHSFTRGNGWIGNYVRHFAESGTGDVYLTTFDGKILRFAGNGFEQLPQPPGDPLAGIFPHVDETGTLWALGPQFIGRFTGGKWSPAASVSLPAGEHYLGACSGRGKHLWIITREQVRKFRGDTLVFTGPGPGESFDVWRIDEDSGGTLWFSSMERGLYRFRPAVGADYSPAGEWRHFTMADGLSASAIRFTFEDREGTLWIGTDGGGLQRFRNRLLRTIGTGRNDLTNRVWGIAEDQDGSMLLCKPHWGLARLEGTNETPVFWPGSTNPITSAAQCALRDRKGRLWIGVVNGGLCLVDGAMVQTFSTAQINGGAVTSFFEDSAGRVWIGTRDGISSFQDGHFQSYRLDGAARPWLIRCIAEDVRDRTIWIGGDMGGLFRLENDRFVRVPEADALARQSLRRLLADPDGTLWIGTRFDGLARLRQGRVARILNHDGIPGNEASIIVDDGTGHFWIKVSAGLVRVSRAALHAVFDGKEAGFPHQYFAAHDGLVNIDFIIGHQQCALRDRQGRLWFSTSLGPAVIHPANLRLNLSPPPLVIRKVQLDDRSALNLEPFSTGKTTPTPAVNVPAGARRIEVHYAALSFAAPEKVRYRYLLEGSDADWIDVGNRRAAYFQDLKPGRYRFRVKAANNDGVWNETGTALALIVEPRWYQTWTFRGVVVLVLALGALAGHKFRVRRIERHRDQLEKRVSERTKQLEAANQELESFSYSVSHDLRAPLRGIDGFSLALLEDHADKLDQDGREALQRVRAASQRMEGLIDDMLTLSRLSRAELHRTTVDLGALARTIADELRATQPDRKVHFEIAPGLNVHADANLLRIALQNLLSNAWKFTGRHSTARIELGIQSRNGQAVYFVRDDGAGFDEAFAGKLFRAFQRLHAASQFHGTGVGLAIVQRVIHRHGGRIWAESAVEKGATFYFTLPDTNDPGTALIG